jgi:hypothetical protein
MPEKGKQVKRNRTLKTGKSSEWALAIERAQSHLQKNRIQAARLRGAIRLFAEKLAAGEQWPGLQQSSTHN